MKRIITALVGILLVAASGAVAYYWPYLPENDAFQLWLFAVTSISFTTGIVVSLHAAFDV